MRRLLLPKIKKDLHRKIILLTGPRQCGKTTLAKMTDAHYEYFNYDDVDQRLAIHKKKWDRTKSVLILGEIHKMPQWKRWLKGVYDTEGLHPPIVVTGSAKLDTYRKVGDSLAGRYFQFHVHPFDLKEILKEEPKRNAEKTLDRLLEVGGFPEPFLVEEAGYYQRWQKSHLDIILKQDLIDLESVQNIVQIQTLIQLLKKRVGSPLSYSSLAEDLQCSDKTVKRWLTLLENMYVIFKVVPYHKNIARALLKQPKYYFYDTGQVDGDEGVRLENLTACALLKEIQYQSDALGCDWQLFYLRNKMKQEVDFLITDGEKKHIMIEVKLGDENPSGAFFTFTRQFKGTVTQIQIVKNLHKEYSYPKGVLVKKASSWLAKMIL